MLSYLRQHGPFGGVVTTSPALNALFALLAWVSTGAGCPCSFLLVLTVRCYCEGFRSCPRALQANGVLVHRRASDALDSRRGG